MFIQKNNYLYQRGSSLEMISIHQNISKNVLINVLIKSSAVMIIFSLSYLPTTKIQVQNSI